MVSPYGRKPEKTDSPTKEELDDSAQLDLKKLTMAHYNIHNHIITELQHELPADS
jgi:hypothetical protein